MTVDITRVRWKEVNGSIFTEASYEKKLVSKVVELPLSVAFNVGRDVALNIVEKHNTSLG
jgi:hypothetical protein